MHIAIPLNAAMGFCKFEARGGNVYPRLYFRQGSHGWKRCGHNMYNPTCVGTHDQSNHCFQLLPQTSGESAGFLCYIWKKKFLLKDFCLGRGFESLPSHFFNLSSVFPCSPQATGEDIPRGITVYHSQGRGAMDTKSVIRPVPQWTEKLDRLVHVRQPYP